MAIVPCTCFDLNMEGIISPDFSEFPTILWYFPGCLDCIDWKTVLLLSTQLLYKYAKIDMETSQIDIIIFFKCNVDIDKAYTIHNIGCITNFITPWL